MPLLFLPIIFNRYYCLCNMNERGIMRRIIWLVVGLCVVFSISSVLPVQITNAVSRTAKAIAVGEAHTCVILDNDNVKCWGWDNEYGQLGYDDTTARGTTAGSMAALGTVNLGAGHTAKAISAGGGHTCVILDDNKVKC